MSFLLHSASPGSPFTKLGRTCNKSYLGITCFFRLQASSSLGGGGGGPKFYLKSRAEEGEGSKSFT